MGITEILRRIWLFSASKMKSSESFSKQPIQRIVELNSSLRHIIVTLEMPSEISPLLKVKSIDGRKHGTEPWYPQLIQQ